MNGKQKFLWKEMTMGTCYYPEHWEESLWESDLLRMKEAGISVIRIAEFAWNKIEPGEGIFDFSFFDRFLKLCLEKDMKVIFCTPTATPPAWLTERHPEVLNARPDGVRYRHGGRKHYNYNSPVYREYCRRIVTQSAMHYGPHPAVIGWQIDNELNCELNEFYSEADDAAFRRFLREKYGDLDSLNRAWGTAFWNQTYTDWEEVHLLCPVPSQGVNPHRHLDYLRFVSESAVSFCRMQAEIVRQYCKEGDFITTNGMFGHLDNHRMERECLDFYTYDSYPNFAYGLGTNPKEDPLNDRWNSKNQNEVRSVCPHYGIMEQQAGAGGWTTRMEGPAPRPGQLTLWAMQSVAHGADFVSFFRWRTCTFGTEIYWHGILDYDSRDNRKLREVKDFYRKLKALDPVCGAEYVACFGLLKDYDNLWDREADAWHRRISCYSEDEIFAGAELTNLPYDVIYLQENSEPADLAKYPVLIYPHPVIMNRERAALLEDYVSQGGTLVLGCRSGLKNENGICEMLPQPGLLQRLTGTDVRDFTYVSPAEEETYALWKEEPAALAGGAAGQEEPPAWGAEGGITPACGTAGQEQTSAYGAEGGIAPAGGTAGQTRPPRLETPVFNDILTPLAGTQVLAVYANSYYAGEAALTRRRVGKGAVLHLGSAFSRDTAAALLRYAGVKSPFEELAEADGTQVELTLRKKDGRTFLFALNFHDRRAHLTLKKPMRALFEDRQVCGSVVLPAFGTAVYELE